MNIFERVYRFLGAVAVVGVLSLLIGFSVAVASPTTTPSDDAAQSPLPTSETQGPQFYADQFIEVSGVVDGDVYAAGQDITISGDVNGDVIAAAQTITITGAVDGNVRLAGQNVMISGDVSRSATVLGETVNVTDTARLGDDLVGSAGQVVIAGDIGRDLLVGVDELGIQGSVGGDVTYYSENQANIADGAVSGAVQHIASSQRPVEEPSGWAVFVGWLTGLAYALVALSLVTIFAGLVMPRWLRHVTHHLIVSPWKALLVGFVAALAVPVVLLVLMVTIIGIPLALGGALVWSVLTLFTFVYGAFYLGQLVLRRAGYPVFQSLVGGLILIIALHIPWLNIVVWLAMVFFGLGAQLLAIHGQRPWKTISEMDAELHRL